MFTCFHCRRDYGGFWVHNHVWNAALPPKERGLLLCTYCLEARLGRQLTPEDFDFTVRGNDLVLLGIRMGMAQSAAQIDAFNREVARTNKRRRKKKTA